MHLQLHFICITKMCVHRIDELLLIDIVLNYVMNFNNAEVKFIFESSICLSDNHDNIVFRNINVVFNEEYNSVQAINTSNCLLFLFRFVFLTFHWLNHNFSYTFSILVKIYLYICSICVIVFFLLFWQFLNQILVEFQNESKIFLIYHVISWIFFLSYFT